MHRIFCGGDGCVVNMMSLWFVSRAGQSSAQASYVCFPADPLHADVCNESELIRHGVCFSL